MDEEDTLNDISRGLLKDTVHFNQLYDNAY